MNTHVVGPSLGDLGSSIPTGPGPTVPVAPPEQAGNVASDLLARIAVLEAEQAAARLARVELRPTRPARLPELPQFKGGMSFTLWLSKCELILTSHSVPESQWAIAGASALDESDFAKLAAAAGASGTVTQATSSALASKLQS